MLKWKSLLPLSTHSDESSLPCLSTVLGREFLPRLSTVLKRELLPCQSTVLKWEFPPSPKHRAGGGELLPLTEHHARVGAPSPDQALRLGGSSFLSRAPCSCRSSLSLPSSHLNGTILLCLSSCSGGSPSPPEHLFWWDTSLPSEHPLGQEHTSPPEHQLGWDCPFPPKN